MSGARDGLARSVQVRLVRHAHAIGVDPNLVLTHYAVERLLYRLSRSSHAERFVLKGARDHPGSRGGCRSTHRAGVPNGI